MFTILLLATLAAPDSYTSSGTTPPADAASFTSTNPDAKLVAGSQLRVTIAGHECDGPGDLGKRFTFDRERFVCVEVPHGYAWSELAPYDGVQLDLWQLAALIVIPFLAGFAASLLTKGAQAIRNDGDPSNDWLADLMESARDALGRGEPDRAQEILSAARTVHVERKKANATKGKV